VRNLPRRKRKSIIKKKDKEKEKEEEEAVSSASESESDNDASPKKKRKKESRKRKKSVEGRVKKRARQESLDKHFVPPQRRCRHWAKGSCIKGASCQFAHSGTAGESKLCRHFLMGHCTMGGDCNFSHDLRGFVPRRPCTYWETKGECARGNECTFLHAMRDDRSDRFEPSRIRRDR